ncbi:MAG TPA: histidine phosphatase family protein [Firmicutes bacterium]|nr:histidine phosphatase family protein [Bacillota bacterium]
MRIILARHGQTDSNAANRFQGCLDIPLNAKGLRQARLLAGLLARYQPQKLYTSDLTRSKETAQPAAKLLQLVPVADPVFREYSWGILEGLTWDEARDRYPQHFSGERPPLHLLRVPGQEPREHFHRRVQEGLAMLLAEASLPAVALIGHGHYLNGLLVEFLGLDFNGPWPFSFASAAVTVLEVKKGRRRLLCFNDMCHLGEKNA